MHANLSTYINSLILAHTVDTTQQIATYSYIYLICEFCYIIISAYIYRLQVYVCHHAILCICCTLYQYYMQDARVGQSLPVRTCTHTPRHKPTCTIAVATDVYHRHAVNNNNSANNQRTNIRVYVHAPLPTQQLYKHNVDYVFSYEDYSISHQFLRIVAVLECTLLTIWLIGSLESGQQRPKPEQNDEQPN